LKPPDTGEARGTETILVVEDDDAVRAYSTQVLRELGYRVLEAPNASAALEILGRQADVHLLFTDIGLPGAMNGRVIGRAGAVPG
jgi:CheY-like chemotaxis protein